VTVRTGLAEPGNRAIDQARIDGRKLLVVEAVATERPDLVILDQDIRFPGQRSNQRLSFGMREVDRYRLLVPVGAGEEHTFAGAARRIWKERGETPRIVARPRPLHFDHLGAKIAQHLRGPRPREYPRQVENPARGQRAGSGRPFSVGGGHCNCSYLYYYWIII
jgi:hypothetical protein